MGDCAPTGARARRAHIHAALGVRGVLSAQRRLHAASTTLRLRGSRQWPWRPRWARRTQVKPDHQRDIEQLAEGAWSVEEARLGFASGLIGWFKDAFKRQARRYAAHYEAITGKLPRAGV